jgi:glycosyltransferase involved in cell wall biosynthesis
VFCLSSRYEGFGLVLLEAMAFGLPIVSTDCETGPKELLKHGENALLVQPDNAESLAQGLLQLIQKPDRAAQIGATGREKAGTFALQDIAANWGTLIERM